MKRDDDYLRELLSDLEGDKDWRVQLIPIIAPKDTVVMYPASQSSITW